MLLKNSIWVSKNAEFHADFKSVERFFEKMNPKKSYQQKRDGNMHFFSLLLMFIKLVLLVTFFWFIFYNFSTDQREILRFLISFLVFLQKKILGVILGLFANFEAKCAKNGSKKSKNVFCKCVLDFNFAPIKGYVFFIFHKKSNSLYPTLGPSFLYIFM